MFLRTYTFTTSPPGFYSDEALYGYEAYSLLKSGKDQFGNSWPLSLAGFGDYRPALYIYSTIPSIWLFGLSAFATRLPSIVFSVATVVVTYLLIKKVTKHEKAALFGALLLSISPWSIYFGRMAHETNLMTLLIVSGVYVLYENTHSFKALFLSILLFALSMYTYHSARVFVPLFILLSAVIYYKQLRNIRKNLLIGIIVFLLLLLPLIFELSPRTGLSRVSSVGFWNDPGLTSYINELRASMTVKFGGSMAKVFINKATVYPFVFLSNFLKHFSPSFLFLNGDPNGVYNTPYTGILLLLEPLFLFFGTRKLWQRNKRACLLIIGAIAISLIPDSLTRFSPSSARIHLVLPFLALLNGMGMESIFKIKFKIRFIIVSLLIINLLWFWYSYLIILPLKNERAWQIGTSELIQKTQKLSANYGKIWMSRSCWGWIHVVFHTAYDPRLFQIEAQHSEKNDLGFWWVSDFGKYHLENFPKNGPYEPNVLYVGTPDEFPDGTRPIDIVVSPYSKKALFYIVDGASLYNSLAINPSAVVHSHLQVSPQVQVPSLQAVHFP